MLPPGEYKREVGLTCHSDSTFCQITLVLIIIVIFVVVVYYCSSSRAIVSACGTHSSAFQC